MNTNSTRAAAMAVRPDPQKKETTVKKLNANASSGGFNPAGGLTVVGNNDPEVSPYLKIWIAQGSTCVVGVIGEGTSKEITANWDSPFGEDALASQYRKIDGGLQIVTGAVGEALGGSGAGVSTRTATQTTQIWSGNEATAFTLVLIFYALADAKKEVVDAIQALEEMASPNFIAMGAASQEPGVVTLNIGRKLIIKDCVIKNISAPLDGPRTQNGYLARAEVTLQIETKAMQSRADVTGSYQ